MRYGFRNNMATELNPSEEHIRIMAFVMEDNIQLKSEEKEAGNFQ